MTLDRRAFLLAPALGLLPAAAFARGPRPANSVEKHLPDIDRIVGDVMRRTGVPGVAVAVVSRDRVVYLRGFGLRRAGEAAPVDADTVFPIASLSKPLATTVIAGLVGDGVVGWDDRMIRHDPDFALSDPWVTRDITLRDLLCHRSGLPDHAGDLLEDIGYGRAEILRRLRYIKPLAPFRASYAYTNFGFTAAAVAAAKAAGKDWEELCADRLYQPLGMTRTSSRHADLVARDNRAFGHVRRDGRWIVGQQRQPDAQAPAGGVSASVRDMTAWLRLQLARGVFDGREIVKPEALDETHRPHIATNRADPATAAPSFYGLGWDIGYATEPLVRWGHSGAFDLGAATCVNILPAEQLGVVVLTNGAPVGAPEAICRSFLDLVVRGRIERDWLTLFGGVFAKMAEPPYGRDANYAAPPPGAAAPAPLENYVGVYGNDLYGPVTVTQGVNALNLLLGPNSTKYVMDKYAGDVFAFQPSGENAYGPSPVRFVRDGRGPATSVRIDYFDTTGQGVFRRV